MREKRVCTMTLNKKWPGEPQVQGQRKKEKKRRRENSIPLERDYIVNHITKKIVMSSWPVWEEDTWGTKQL